MPALAQLTCMADLAAYVDTHVADMSVKPLVRSLKLFAWFARAEHLQPLRKADRELLTQILDPLEAHVG